MSNSNIDNEVVQNMSKEQRKQLNADPISGEPGAHPIGTGVGAAGGATIGAVGGPVGVTVGGLVGTVVGGLAGKSISEAVNPTDEDVYWRETYNTRPYFKDTINLYDNVDYDRDYRDAYQLGYTSRSNYPYETKFEEVEADLKLQWEKTKRESRLKWEEAKHAVKDAWDRVTR